MVGRVSSGKIAAGVLEDERAGSAVAGFSDETDTPVFDPELSAADRGVAALAVAGETSVDAEADTGNLAAGGRTAKFDGDALS
jgi:hypothetical protein